MADASPARLEALRGTFELFGRTEAVAQRSPVYEHLCRTVAADDALLALAAGAQVGQPAPNLLFAAVQAVLDEHRTHRLAAYYVSVGGDRAPDAELDGAFRDFVGTRRDAIAETLRTRLVQTNEVRRSVALLPAFRTVSDAAAGAPVALIEIGPSAGLNLLFDRYGYRYGDVLAGDAASPVQLAVDVRGARPPVDRVPAVASRTGIDLHALDVRDDADARWLRALTWPEHDERRRVLAAAITVARADPPRLVSGDVFAWLPGAIAAAPPGAAVTVFATFVINQFTRAMRDRLRALLLDASRQRPLWCVVLRTAGWGGLPLDPPESVRIWLLRLTDGAARARPLGALDAHGWWIEWAPGAETAW